MKKLTLLFLALFIVASLLSSCKGNTETGKKDEVPSPTNASQSPSDESTTQPAANDGIAMITSGGTIDDHSFNAMLWKGLARAGNDFGFKPAFIEETGGSAEELLEGMTTLYNNGNRLIFCPGMALIGAMNEARQMYSDLNIAMIDTVVDPFSNVASTSFDVLQAGYIAGVAAAVELGEAEFGFIGGMEFPEIQAYNWGFQQGLAAANYFYGTTATIVEENVIYCGDFGNFMLGQTLASEMYDRGVNVILVAAGQTGMGVIDAAKSRILSSHAWVITVDFDQYERGIYEGEKSVILTSAMKKYDSAAYEIIRMHLDGKFPGGQEIRMDIHNNGVGLPEENPNLSQGTLDAVAERVAALIDGSNALINYPDPGSIIP